MSASGTGSRSPYDPLGSGAACRLSPTDRPASNLCVLGEGERVFDVHPEVAHGALDLCMTQEQLHRSQVARSFVDDRCLGPPERVRPILLATQPDRSHPLVYQPGILPSAEV